MNLLNLFIEVFKTSIATVIGGYLTINLFKKQESMKLRQSLKVDFYKQYNAIFKKVYPKIEEIRDSYLYIYEYREEFELDYQYSGGDVSFKLNLDCLNLNLIYEIEVLINRLVKYIEDEETVFEYTSNPYESIQIDLMHLKQIAQALCAHEEFIKNNIKYSGGDNLKHYIYLYNDTLKDIVNYYDYFDDMLRNMHKIHKKIKNEILGPHFKPKEWILES